MAEQKSIHGVGTDDDPALRERLLNAIDNLEQMNDWVGDREVRHAVSEYLVKARLMIRDGNLDKLNGGAERRMK